MNFKRDTCRNECQNYQASPPPPQQKNESFLFVMALNNQFYHLPSKKNKLLKQYILAQWVIIDS